MILTYGVAVLSFAMLCGLWVGLQSANGALGAGDSGRCGACAERERCERGSC